jgi:lysophospholipase L1-like esterase
VWACSILTAGAQTDTACPELARAIQDVMRQDARLRDWPQLARYRAANTELKHAGTRVDVVFLGDSITDGWDDPAAGGFFPAKAYVNRGISGQTTPQMLVRMKPDVLALKPRALVLLAGTNDIAGNTGPMTNEEIQDNIAAIAELAAAHDIRVVLASILPVSNYHFAPAPGAVPQIVRRPPARITALNEWLRTYAAHHGVVYLDYYREIVDEGGMLKAEFSADDLHPNAKGYAVMAPLAATAIAKALR